MPVWGVSCAPVEEGDGCDVFESGHCLTVAGWKGLGWKGFW